MIINDKIGNSNNNDDDEVNYYDQRLYFPFAARRTSI